MNRPGNSPKFRKELNALVSPENSIKKLLQLGCHQMQESSSWLHLQQQGKRIHTFMEKLCFIGRTENRFQRSQAANARKQSQVSLNQRQLIQQVENDKAMSYQQWTVPKRLSTRLFNRLHKRYLPSRLSYQQWLVPK